MRRTRLAVLRTAAIAVLSAALAAVGACSAATSTPSASVSRVPADPVTTSSTTSQGAGSYVDQVSALCTTLKAQRQAIVESFPPHFPVADFLADTAKSQPFLDAFDARLAALPVRPADQAAAEAFAAYVKESTAARQMRVAAAQRSQSDYDAEYDRQITMFNQDPVLLAIDRLGFSGACHYR